MLESHVAQPHLATLDGDRLTGQQPSDGDDDLLQRCQRRARQHAHLSHPFLHTVTDAGQQPAGGEPAQGGDLHGGDGRVASHGREDAQPHLEPFGDGEGSAGQADSGGVEAVLDEPDLVGATLVETAGHLGHESRRECSIEAHPGGGTGAGHPPEGNRLPSLDR